jgi:dethiobiotin synthetase
VHGLFVTGTDTGVGKTIVSAALLAAMAAAGEPVRAHKPVVTGLDEQPAWDPSRGPDYDPHGAWPADHELLASAAGMAPDDVTPLRYGPAVSPDLAAALAGERVEPARLLAAAQAADDDRVVVVEGVGGLLSPLAEDFTVCDLAAVLAMPVVVAARPGLGTINHTLLTIRTARAAGLHVCAVVLTPWPRQPSALERWNRETIARMGVVDVAALRPVAVPEPAVLAEAGASLPWRDWLGQRPEP